MKHTGKEKDDSSDLRSVGWSLKSTVLVVLSENISCNGHGYTV